MFTIKLRSLVLLLLLFSWPKFYAQSYWKENNTQRSTAQEKTYTYYTLERKAFEKALHNTSARSSQDYTYIDIPDGTSVKTYKVRRTAVLSPELAQRYPQIETYSGYALDNSDQLVSFTWSPAGLSAIFQQDFSYTFVQPTDRRGKNHKVYQRSDVLESVHFDCTTQGATKKTPTSSPTQRNSYESEHTLRTIRIAVAATSSFTQYFGGKIQTLAQIASTIQRANQVYRSQMSVQFQLVSGEETLIEHRRDDNLSNYINQNWTGSQLQKFLDDRVGTANYDVGHLFHNTTNPNGNAGCIGCVCDDNSKGKAFSAGNLGSMDIDRFDIDFFCHELGHQMGANHTHNLQNEGYGVQVEPGSGSTIMGYAGITGNNDVQSRTDPYFNHISVRQIVDYIKKQSCPTTENVSNTPPQIADLSNYTIPKGTAYVLDGTATDPDGDKLYYTWEQADTMSQTVTTVVGDYKYGPKFRSLSPTTNPTRYFPKLSSVLAGKLVNEQEWEAVSNIARELNFNVTVRDNSPNVQEQQTATAKMKVTVTNDGPFSIINKKVFNNTITDITWDTAKTEAAPYNVANVKVDYSIDGGNTWTVLSESTPNDGGEKYDFKTLADDAVLYVRISAIDNIFYTVKKFSISKAVECDGSPVLDLNTSNITINEATVSWEGVVNADKYSLRYKKTSDTDWTTVEVNSTSHHLTNLEENVEYELGVASVCSGTVGTYAETTFQTKKLEYCPSESKNATDGHIINVTVTNHQGTKVSNDSQGKPYSDFTEEPEAYITLEKGSENNRIDVTKGWRANKYNEGVSAWIDFNRDGIFDDSEKILSSSPSKTNPAYRTFDVPNDAYTGNYPVRLRVILKYGETPKSGCETGFNYGEVEDYSVFIKENLAVNDVQAKAHQIVLYPNPATDVLNLSKASANATYEIYSTAGNLVQKGKVVDAKISITSLAQGVYIINVNDNGASQKLKFIKKP